jgi:hypothetical protein
MTATIPVSTKRSFRRGKVVLAKSAQNGHSKSANSNKSTDAAKLPITAAPVAGMGMIGTGRLGRDSVALPDGLGWLKLVQIIALAAAMTATVAKPSSFFFKVTAAPRFRQAIGSISLLARES